MLFHIVAILKPLPKHVLQFVYLLIPLSLLLSMQVLENILLGAIYLQEIYKRVLPWVPSELNVSPLFFSALVEQDSEFKSWFKIFISVS